MYFIYLTVYDTYGWGHSPLLPVRGMEGKRRRVPQGGEGRGGEYLFSSPAPSVRARRPVPGFSVRSLLSFRVLEQHVRAGPTLVAEPPAAGISCGAFALGLNLTASWRLLPSEGGGPGWKEGGDHGRVDGREAGAARPRFPLARPRVA